VNISRSTAIQTTVYPKHHRHFFWQLVWSGAPSIASDLSDPAV